MKQIQITKSCPGRRLSSDRVIQHLIRGVASAAVRMVSRPGILRVITRIVFICQHHIITRIVLIETLCAEPSYLAKELTPGCPMVQDTFAPSTIVRAHASRKLRCRYLPEAGRAVGARHYNTRASTPLPRHTHAPSRVSAYGDGQ
jgi:hypothetical protein